MSEMKTTPGDGSVQAYLESVENAGRREDALVMLELMNKLTGARPVLWGESIVGYGTYEYVRADGSQQKFFVTGFAPRKANLTVYVMPGFKAYEKQLERLGKHKKSVSCLYLPRLKNVDLDALSEIIVDSIETMKNSYDNCTI